MSPKHLIHIAVACALGLIVLSVIVAWPVASDVAASDPPPYVPLEVVGQLGGSVRTVAVQGDFAYVGIGRRLVVMDISTPSRPVVTGGTEHLQGGIADVAVVGNRAYVVASEREPLGWVTYIYGVFAVVDISNPAHPTILSYLRMPRESWVRAVDVAGDRAYLIDDKGLWTIDVSNSAAPTILGRYWYSRGYVRVAASGDTVYVTGDDEEREYLQFTAIDVSDPTNPTLAGHIDALNHTSDMEIVGNLLYVTGRDGFRVLDISDPLSPTLLGRCDTPIDQHLAVAGDLAYIADSNGELFVIDVSDLTHPLPQSHYNMVDAAEDMAAAGGYVYLSCWRDGLVVIDARDPTAPTVLSRYERPRKAKSVAVQGDYAYVADDALDDLAGRLLVIDVADPVSPMLVGQYEMDGHPKGVAVAGRYAYVTVDSVFLVLDISDPASPTPVGECGVPRTGDGITIFGNVAYVAHMWTGGLMVIDISNPAAPLPLSVCTEAGDARSIAVTGNIACVAAGSDGLLVLDVTNPISPTMLGQATMPYEVYDVAVSGTLAYVADYDAGLSVFDVSDPSAPVLVGTGYVPGAWKMALAGNLAYLTTWTQIWMIDVVDPTRPRALANIPLPDEIHEVTVAGDTVYVTSDADGLVILRGGPAQPNSLRLPLIMVHAQPRRHVDMEVAGQIGGGVSAVAVRGEIAYVGIGPRLAVLDLSDPVTVTLAGQTDLLPEVVEDVVVDGDLAYALDEKGFSIIDVSDPALPTPLGRWDTTYQAKRLAVEGDLACVIDDGGLAVVDVSDPTAPSWWVASRGRGLRMWSCRGVTSLSLPVISWCSISRGRARRCWLPPITTMTSNA